MCQNRPALLAGLASGLLFVLPATGLLPLPAIGLAQFAPLPLYLAGLSGGAPAAVVAGLAGLAVTILIELLAQGSIHGVVAYAMIDAVPAAVLCHFALLSRPVASGTEWYPSGHLLAWLVGMAATVLALHFLWYAVADDGLVVALERGVGAWLDAQSEATGEEIPPEMRAMFLAAVPFAPRAVAAVQVLMVAINGMLAQHILLRRGKAVRPVDRLRDLVLPRRMAAALGVAVLASFVPGFIGNLAMAVAITLSVAYFLAGLAVVHALARGTSGGRVMLFVFYALLVVVMMAAAPLGILVAGIGLIDQLAGLRRRIGGPGNGPKEE